MNYVLQPCKCGNMYPEIYHDTIRHYFQCRCENCKAHTDKYKSEAEAVMAWNAYFSTVPEQRWYYNDIINKLIDGVYKEYRWIDQTNNNQQSGMESIK